MANVVLTLSQTVISKMRTYYASTIQQKTPQGAIFLAKPASCTITAYKSGKVMFQGSNNTVEAAKWGTPSESAPTKKKSTVKKATLPDNFAKLSVIGSDEVGTGDFFGPMTVVSAYVSKENIPLLQELGVKDSKQMTDAQIIALAKQLIKIIPYSLLTLKNKKYNEMQSSGMSQGKLKALLHNQAITHLLEKMQPLKPEAILIDQFAEPKVYYNYLTKQKTIQKENVYFSTKGESVHIAVAAASIIARYAFLKKMDALSEEAGFTLPKGAGAQVDQAAARLIKAKGESVLIDFTKQHFANTKKAKALIK